jgi:hypothetical protein
MLKSSTFELGYILWQITKTEVTQCSEDEDPRLLQSDMV